jgi:polypeptide N-acetylgalactosaminyltransferase
MGARNHGAALATGLVLVFLDAHIEALHGWLPPLLERIQSDERNVAMPAIDGIDADTFEVRFTLAALAHSSVH